MKRETKGLQRKEDVNLRESRERGQAIYSLPMDSLGSKKPKLEPSNYLSYIL